MSYKQCHFTSEENGLQVAYTASKWQLSLILGIYLWHWPMNQHAGLLSPETATFRVACVVSSPAL
jgi:hypothetical protein